MRPFAVALALLFAVPAAAQTVTDGDTIKQGGHVYRIHGIDAPELKQDCDGWPAGRLAATAMQELVAGRTVTCQTLDRDRYGREVAKCFAGGVDLGGQMVRRGWAWAFVKFSRDYAGLEAEAKRDNLGVHAHGCRPAWEWRAERRN